MLYYDPINKARLLKEARKIAEARRRKKYNEENKEMKASYDKHRYKIKHNLPLE